MWFIDMILIGYVKTLALLPLGYQANIFLVICFVSSTADLIDVDTTLMFRLMLDVQADA